MGSVMPNSYQPLPQDFLPAGLGDSGDLPPARQLPKADTAHLELPHVPAGSTAEPAPVDAAHAELRRPLGLGDHRLLGHCTTPLPDQTVLPETRPSLAS